MQSNRHLRKLETLSRRQRQATPPEFAAYLVNRVIGVFECSRVAVLWCDAKSNYFKLLPHCEVYTARRNAWTYSGPFPVICHPPCGPWGKYRRRCNHSIDDGVAAMRMVHTFGGIVEQPLGSTLFQELGTVGKIESVNQADYGHLANKATLLYVVARPQDHVDLLY